jgi:RNA polymerase sigma-70 factor (ECF subfamily)
VQLYDHLYSFTPTPIVALNRAIAIAETGETEGALGILDSLELDGYYLLHATRADLLTRLDRWKEAEASYEKAIPLTTNTAEIRFLTERRDALRTRYH